MTVYACHCSACQSRSGSAFCLTIMVPFDAIETMQGELDQFEKEPFVFHNCASCGGSLWVDYPLAPDIRILRAGTLDDTCWLEPVAHLWTSEAQSWIGFNDGAKLYEEGPKGEAGAQELIDLCQSRQQAGC